MKETWNGLAFSPDGKEQCFVSGGDSGRFIFSITRGEVSFDRSVAPEHEGTEVSGEHHVHPTNGKLYVCNEANREIWVWTRTLALEKTIPVGLHPHSCLFGGDHTRILQISDWGNRAVSVVDTQKGRRVRDIEVGIRPNDLALSKDGRLFVACSGDNTVHVIQTRAIETATEPDASPARRLPEGTREIISTSLYPESPEGSTPDAVAVSPDGKTLFIANADNNCVAVVDISFPNSTSESAREESRVGLAGGRFHPRSAGIPARWPSVPTIRRYTSPMERVWPRAPTSHPKPRSRSTSTSPRRSIISAISLAARCPSSANPMRRKWLHIPNRFG